MKNVRRTSRSENFLCIRRREMPTIGRPASWGYIYVRGYIYLDTYIGHINIRVAGVGNLISVLFWCLAFVLEDAQCGVSEGGVYLSDTP